MFDKKCSDPFANKVKCETCKHWLDKDDTKKVPVFYSHNGYEIFQDNLYYCPEHKKHYEKKVLSKDKYRFYNLLEVDLNGNPIGYKKIKE